ncbi:MAG: L-2-amino-thiazoline-4-carboxylic acid hydrolase [Actinomycetota bacterium]
MGDGPKITLLERTKIQAEVLVPLIRAMEAELGRERTHHLVRDALGGQIRESVRAATAPGQSRATVEWALRISRAGDAQDHERLDAAEDEINLNVTRCAFAEFFQELGEPELGFLLVCSLDYDIADGAGVALERSHTIMQGSDHCDFRFSNVSRTQHH